MTVSCSASPASGALELEILVVRAACTGRVSSSNQAHSFLQTASTLRQRLLFKKHASMRMSLICESRNLRLFLVDHPQTASQCDWLEGLVGGHTSLRPLDPTLNQISSEKASKQCLTLFQSALMSNPFNGEASCSSHSECCFMFASAILPYLLFLCWPFTVF